MAEAVTAVEGTLEAERCALDEVRCGDRAYPCGLHQTWTAIVSNLSDQLAGLSLAQALDRDVANRKAAAGQLTQAPRRPRS